MPVIKLDITDAVRQLERIRGVVQGTIAKRALTHAGIEIANAIKRRTPIRRSQKKQRTKPHLRHAITYEIRDYGNVQVAVVGAPAGASPHQWLVEDGTKQRFTNQRRIRRRTDTGQTEQRTRTYRRKNGEIATKAYSKKIWNINYETRQRYKRKPVLNRGRMPAFHMFRDGKAVDSVSIIQKMTNELKGEIEGLQLT